MTACFRILTGIMQAEIFMSFDSKLPTIYSHTLFGFFEAGLFFF